MSSRESSPSFVELPVLPPSRRISAARRRLTTPTTLAKDDGGAENDRPLSQSGETDEASHTHRDSTASLQNSHSHSQAHSGHIGDLSLDAASDRGSSGTPHSPALRSPASIVSTSAGPMPPQARRKLSTAASSSAAAAAACDTSLSSSSLTARRMWTHFAERDVLTAHRAASPNDMESSCPLGVEPLPLSRADTTHGSPWPSSSPTAKMAPSGVTKTAHEANLKSPCTRSPSLPPSSSEVVGPILQPRSSARRPSAALQSGASRDFPQVQVDATRAAVADERALSTSSSPSTPPSTSFKQEDGAATRAAGEEKRLTNFLPALHTTSASWCEEKDNTAHFHGAPATLSFPTRLRLHQSGPPPPRRLSQQVSLSFECAEEEKTMTSTTNSESLPPHGLSPSSAVPSDAQSSVPFFSDLLWRARASRVDLRSPPSSTHSSQRHELEAQPPRSCSAMLAERRVSLPTPALQPLDQPETLYDFDRASPRAWHLLNEPPPRTRSAVYSATPSRIRGAHLVPPINDANHLARSTGGHTRSSTSHGARCAVAAPRSASQRSTRATTLTADAPLRPRLNPLLHSPPSAPRYPGGQPPLTPLRCESPAGSVGRFDGATPQIGRSRTPSQERFSPLHQPMASLPFPGPRRGPTALPSIPATPRMVSSCPPEPFGTEGEEEEREHEAAGVDGRSAVERRRCSSPRRAAAAVPFSLASTRRTGEGGNVWSSSPSTQDVSAVEEEAVTAVEYASPTPPPPPWTPAEALYWMSSRLTRQEAREMLTYDQVYYCGPAVPPRTACGVTETSSAVSRGKEALHYGGEDGVHAAGPPRLHLANQNPAAASPSSYFPITLGMHIRFRYEVTEVLGFGTFSVVVRAIDHAAAPLSPERHCALKLIRKEALYQQAAQDEWATYTRVKACCGAPVDGEEEGDRDNPSNVDVVDASAASPHHRRRSSCPGPSLSLTQRLSTADQRTICGAAIVTPRTRFEFRGYHVMVLPLLGFSLRDVLELRRESDEAAVKEDAEFAIISDARPVLSFSEAATGFSRAVGASILAQVVHALAFLHRTAHLLHGDLKPENVVFVDRMVSQGHTEASPTMPFSDQQRVSFLRNSDGALAPFFAAAHAGATSSTSLVPFFRSSSVGHHYRLFSRSPDANTTDAAAAPAATPPAPEEEAGVHLRTPTLRTTPAASAATPPAALDSAVQWVQSCAAGDASKSGGSVEGERSGGTVRASLSVNHVPHTPSRRTPGLTSSRTGTLAPPHHGPLTDVLTLEDSGEESAVASASRIATATATPVSAVPPAFAVEGSRGGSDTAATHHHSASRLSRRNTVASTSSDLALFASATQTSTRIAVIDLGHAKPLAPWQTGTAFPLQSPSYRAPEMALRLPYTTAIDMWSLGCVLYELSTGHVLLPGAGDDATMLSAAVGVLGMPDTTFLAMVKMCWKEYKLRKASGSTATGSDVDALPLNSLSAYVTEGDGGAEAAVTSTTAAAGPVSGLSDEEAAMERCWKSFIQVLNASAGQQRARAERRRRQSTSIYISGNASGNTEPGKAKEGDAAPAVVRVTPWETLAQCALLVELFPDGEVSVAEQTFSLATSVSAPQRPEYFRADFMLGCLYWDATERLSAVEAQYHPYVADLFTTEAEATAGTAATVAEASGQQQQQQPLPHCSGVFYLQHHPLTTRLFTRSQSANGGRRSSEDRGREQPGRDSLPPSRGTSLSTLPLRPLAPSAIFPFDLPSSKRAAPSAKAWEEHQQQRHHQHAATTDGAGENGGWCTPRGQRLSVFCGHSPSPSVEEAGPHASAAAAAALLHIGLHRRDERTPIHDVDLVSPDRHGTEYEAEMDEEEEKECSARQDGQEVMVLRLD